MEQIGSERTSQKYNEYGCIVTSNFSTYGRKVDCFLDKRLAMRQILINEKDDVTKLHDPEDHLLDQKMTDPKQQNQNLDSETQATVNKRRESLILGKIQYPTKSISQNKEERIRQSIREDRDSKLLASHILYPNLLNKFDSPDAPALKILPVGIGEAMIKRASAETMAISQTSLVKIKETGIKIPELNLGEFQGKPEEENKPGEEVKDQLKEGHRESQKLSVNVKELIKKRVSEVNFDEGLDRLCSGEYRQPQAGIDLIENIKKGDNGKFGSISQQQDKRSSLFNTEVQSAKLIKKEEKLFDKSIAINLSVDKKKDKGQPPKPRMSKVKPATSGNNHKKHKQICLLNNQKDGQKFQDDVHKGFTRDRDKKKVNSGEESDLSDNDEVKELTNTKESQILKEYTVGKFCSKQSFMGNLGMKYLTQNCENDKSQNTLLNEMQLIASIDKANKNHISEFHKEVVLELSEDNSKTIPTRKESITGQPRKSSKKNPAIAPSHSEFQSKVFNLHRSDSMPIDQVPKAPFEKISKLAFLNECTKDKRKSSEQSNTTFNHRNLSNLHKSKKGPDRKASFVRSGLTNKDSNIWGDPNKPVCDLKQWDYNDYEDSSPRVHSFNTKQSQFHKRTQSHNGTWTSNVSSAKYNRKDSFMSRQFQDKDEIENRVTRYLGITKPDVQYKNHEIENPKSQTQKNKMNLPPSPQKSKDKEDLSLRNPQQYYRDKYNCENCQVDGSVRFFGCTNETTKNINRPNQSHLSYKRKVSSKLNQSMNFQSQNSINLQTPTNIPRAYTNYQKGLSNNKIIVPDKFLASKVQVNSELSSKNNLEFGFTQLQNNIDQHQKNPNTEFRRATTTSYNPRLSMDLNSPETGDTFDFGYNTIMSFQTTAFPQNHIRKSSMYDGMMNPGLNIGSMKIKLPESTEFNIKNQDNTTPAHKNLKGKKFPAVRNSQPLAHEVKQTSFMAEDALVSNIYNIEIDKNYIGEKNKETESYEDLEDMLGDGTNQNRCVNYRKSEKHLSNMRELAYHQSDQIKMTKYLLVGKANHKKSIAKGKTANHAKNPRNFQDEIQISGKGNAQIQSIFFCYNKNRREKYEY